MWQIQCSHSSLEGLSGTVDWRLFETEGQESALESADMGWVLPGFQGPVLSYLLISMWEWVSCCQDLGTEIREFTYLPHQRSIKALFHPCRALSVPRTQEPTASHVLSNMPTAGSPEIAIYWFQECFKIHLHFNQFPMGFCQLKWKPSEQWCKPHFSCKVFDNQEEKYFPLFLLIPGGINRQSTCLLN